MRKAIGFYLVCAVLCLVPLTDLFAETVNQNSTNSILKKIESLKEESQNLKSLVAQLEQKIAQLESGRAATAEAPTSAPTENRATPVSPTKQANFKSPSLPDIGVVGDLVGATSNTIPEDEGNDRLSLRELELVVGGDLDPFSRFDATVTFSDFEDPSLEEAYVSYWGLPGETKGRAGRLRPRAGKAIAVHRDSLETVDEPLVIQNYFGAEGLSKTGLELSGFFPQLGETLTSQWVLGIMEGGVGEGGTLFGESRNRPSYYAHLSSFLELSDRSDFELGGTYLLGSGDEDAKNEVNAFGVDATLHHHFSPINRFKLQGEFYLVDRDSSDITVDGVTEESSSRPVGFYVVADDRLSKEWGVGVRYDLVEPIALDDSAIRSNDQAYSAYVTYFQSEFARWRFQYQFARLADGVDDDRFFLQGTFALGTHKHQIQ